MKKSTKMLACLIIVIGIIVAVGIGIGTGITEEMLIGIEILNSIKINKGKTEKIEYNLINEKVIIEATSSDKNVLEINEIRDNSIVITGKEKGNATISVQARYKGEMHEKLITVMITDEKAGAEIIEIENGYNITNKAEKIYINNKNEISIFSIKIRRSEMALEETELKVTFDKDIEQEIKGNKVKIFPKENCRMVIEVRTKEQFTIKEYDIIVENTCSTFLI